MKQSYPGDISFEQFERIHPFLERVRKKIRPREVDFHRVSALPEDAHAYADSGYQGLQKDHPDMTFRSS